MTPCSISTEIFARATGLCKLHDTQSTNASLKCPSPKSQEPYDSGSHLQSCFTADVCIHASFGRSRCHGQVSTSALFFGIVVDQRSGNEPPIYNTNRGCSCNTKGVTIILQLLEDHQEPPGRSYLNVSELFRIPKM